MGLYHYNLQELNFYKNQARNQGQRNRVIKDLPAGFRYGQVAEVAVAAILGRLQTYLKTKGIRFYVTCSAYDDRNGVDFFINNRPLCLASKFSYNHYFQIDECIVEYDLPGVKNLYMILNYLGLTEHFIDQQTIGDINNLWFEYMEWYILDGENVKMKS